MAQYQLNYIQLHGDESPLFCKKLNSANLNIIKAFNIHKAFNFLNLANYEPYCDYFLFDASGKNKGGNGVIFDWNLLASYTGSTPFLLSGGIDQLMAKKIKKINHPMLAGVDINSRFESSPAIKDINKIKAFNNELQSR